MKRFKNKILILSGIVCALGVICMGVAMLTVGFDVKALDLCGEPQKVSESYNVQDIKSVLVKLQNSNIAVKKSDDEKIHITYYTTDCCPTKAEVSQNNELMLYDNFWDYGIKQYTKGFFHGYKKHGLVTVIEIPENDNINIVVDISNGNITAENIELNKAEFYSSNGYLDFSDISADTLCADTSNGYITADNINAESAKIDTSNGDVQVSGLTAQKFNAYTSNGSITFKNIIAKNTEASTSNGDVYLTDVKSNNSLNASTSNGSVNIEDISSENISLETSNGSIQGNIIGNHDEYRISSSTSNGNDSLAIYNGKNQTADKKIEAYTSNGNILIEFTE